MPPLLPAARWALTPPFHPYPHGCSFGEPQVRRAVYFLWRSPSGYPARALPGTTALWSPDFPRGACAPRGHPALCAPSAYAAAIPASSTSYNRGLAPLGLRPIHPKVVDTRRKMDPLLIWRKISKARRAAPRKAYVQSAPLPKGEKSSGAKGPRPQGRYRRRTA